MSKEAVNKRWFESKFSTPLSSLLFLSGECISWNMSGHCWYRFDVDTSEKVTSKVEYIDIQCDAIYSSFVKEFKGENDFPAMDKLKCRKNIVDSDVSYWFSEPDGVRNYVWDTFEIQKKFNKQ